MCQLKKFQDFIHLLKSVLRTFELLFCSFYCYQITCRELLALVNDSKLTLAYLLYNQVLLQKLVSNVVVQQNLFVFIAVAKSVRS